VELTAERPHPERWRMHVAALRFPNRRAGTEEEREKGDGEGRDEWGLGNRQPSHRVFVFSLTAPSS